MKRLLSLLLIETFLFTTFPIPHSAFRTPLAWALRTPNASSDGATRQELLESLKSSPVIPGNESALREKIARQSFTRLQRGTQVRAIYLSDDLAIYDLPEYAHVSLSPPFLYWLKHQPVLKSVYQWVTDWASPLAKTIKRKVKLILRYVNGESLAVGYGLKSYRLAVGIDDLIDPFVILDDVSLRMATEGEAIHLPRALVRERNDIFLIDTLKQLAAEGNLEEARARIEEVFRLDERLAERGVSNLDLHFLENTRIRNGRVVLRDLGYLTRDHDLIVFLLRRLREGEWESAGGHPIEKTTAKLSAFSPDLAAYYRHRAYQVYSVENFERHWMAQGGSGAARDGGTEIAAEMVLNDRHFSDALISLRGYEENFRVRYLDMYGEESNVGRDLGERAAAEIAGSYEAIRDAILFEFGDDKIPKGIEADLSQLQSAVENTSTAFRKTDDEFFSVVEARVRPLIHEVTEALDILNRDLHQLAERPITGPDGGVWARDGGRRLQRYQRSPFEDLSLPVAAPLLPIERSIEVASGV